MEFRPQSIPEVILITPQVWGDHRGFFMETYHQQKFAEGGIDATFVQDNHSRSGQGILRGLHYQTQQTQGKLVRVLAGEVFDVAVDIRRSSPTFKQWVGVTLSAENREMLWVPPGFAHGFLVLSPEAEFVYKCTDLYAPQFEQSILWNDPEINIQWPLSKGESPILSAKDEQALPLNRAHLFP
ncbi:MAG: dTDP-4-dehydrorhamnose 3,5-epimerase [Gammaproteobacteria bacterium]|nr:dTDP-4-dehydrorhamnose 3,5-epimerase [Gammaproteobacteria bacterium]